MVTDLALLILLEYLWHILLELYCCEKTRDLKCVEVENALCCIVAHCSCMCEAEGHAKLIMSDV
jgi:hypothetical protein